MSVEELTREQLVDLLNDLLAGQASTERISQDKLEEQSRLMHELQVYQIELEMQNRELREAQITVEEVRDRYTELYDFAPVAYLALDDRYQITSANLTSAQLFKRPRERLLSRSLPSLTGPCRELEQLLNNVRETGTLQTAELPLVVDEQRIYVHAMVSASHDRHANALIYRCALLDITQRRQVERERDQALSAERLLHERFESLDRINMTVNTMLASAERPGMEALLGLVADATLTLMRAQRARVILTASGLGSPAAEAESLLPGYVTGLAELTLTVPMRLGDRKLGVLSVAFDADAKRAQKLQLEEASQTLELLADRLALSLEMARLNQVESRERARLVLLEQARRLLADAYDVEGTCTALSKVCQTVVPAFGASCAVYTKDEAAGLRLCTGTLDPESRHVAHKMARPLGTLLREHESELLESVKTLRFDARELKGIRKLSARKSLRTVLVLPLFARRRVLGFFCVASHEDLATVSAERVAALEELVSLCASALDSAQLLESLRAAVDARDNLLALVSHDLRSPLNAVSLTASALARARPEGERRQRDLAQLNVIQRSITRMSSLVEDLLMAANVESGQFEVAQAAIAPVALIEEACLLNTPFAESRDIALSHECSPHLPEVSADRERILQVLTNLIGNAVKFTPAGGRIRVHAVLSREHVCVSVADTGPGIAPELIDQVFRRFRKGNTGRTGAGLGLYIADRIVSAHGGRIWVESKVGEGASFYFTLPLAHGLGPEPQHPSAKLLEHTQ